MSGRTPIWWGKWSWRTRDGGTVGISALKRSECKARTMADDVFRMAVIWFGAEWSRKALERAIRKVEAARRAKHKGGA